MPTHAVCRRELPILIVAVLIVYVQATHGQSYLLPQSYFLSQNTRNFFGEQFTREPIVKTTPPVRSNLTNTLPSNATEEEDNNSTVIVVKTIRHPSDLSQTTMDIITVVWYVATFLALAAFFLLMACSDRRCSDARRTGANPNDSDTPIPPPTPSPSYSEFAPPSYETVMKMQLAAKTSIFVIPFGLDDEAQHKDSNESNSGTPGTPATTPVTFYTINELQKLGS